MKNFLITIFIGVPLTLWRAFVLYVGWTWIVIPSGITSINLSFLSVFALLYFINIAFNNQKTEQKNTKEMIELLVKNFIWYTFGLPIFFLLKLVCF